LGGRLRAGLGVGIIICVSLPLFRLTFQSGRDLIFSMLLTLSAAILPLFYIKRRGGCAEGKDMEAIQNLVHGGRNGLD
jgi:hypothetical protein